MKNRRWNYLCILLGLVSVGFSNTVADWKSFQSDQHKYRVKYPASWFLFKTDLDQELKSLDILNFPPEDRVRGVILKDGGARIMVAPAPPSIQNIDQWILKDTRFRDQVSQREVSDFARNPLGCSKIVQVTSLEEVGPEAYFSDTSYYCSTKRGPFVISLLNWKDDRNEGRLRKIAFRITLSLRLI